MWPFIDALLSERQCLFIVPRNQMGKGDSRQHRSHSGIAWTEPHCTFEGRDSTLGIGAGIDLHPAKAQQDLRSIHVEAGGLLQKGNGAVMIPPKTESETRPSQHRRIVRVLGDCLPRDSQRLGWVARRAPSPYPATHVSRGKKRLGKCVIWIEGNRLLGIFDRGVNACACVQGKLLQGSEIVVIGIEITGWLGARTIDLGLIDTGFDGADHALGHRVLQLEHVFQRAVEFLRPKMSVGGRLDQLPGDTEATGGLAHAALKYIADTQFPAALLDVHGTAFVGETRIARDHEQRREARKRSNHVFYYAVRKVFLLWITAHVLEGQNSNRRLVWEDNWFSLV